MHRVFQTRNGALAVSGMEGLTVAARRTGQTTWSDGRKPEYCTALTRDIGKGSVVSKVQVYMVVRAVVPRFSQTRAYPRMAQFPDPCVQAMQEKFRRLPQYHVPPARVQKNDTFSTPSLPIPQTTSISLESNLLSPKALFIRHGRP